MTKQESLMMKGVAITLMIFYHLFLNSSNAEGCINFLYVGGKPLAHLITRAMNPVSFFIILSGYGLYISHKKGTYNVWKKLKGLYVHYWISLLIFVTLGSFVAGDRYPGDIVTIIYNVTAWDPSNGEIWFLFPYAMVMLTSKWIVKVLDKFNPWLCLGVTLFISLCTGFVISRYGAQYLYHNQLAYKPILYISFLFSFTIGAYMAKYKEKVLSGFMGRSSVLWGGISGLVIWPLLIALVAFRCCFETGAFHTLYVAAFIVLFVKAPRPKVLDSFLMEMGRRSTSMWFVHTYFCYYLFHEWIYGFRYPLLIFIVLLACSYGSAVVIDWINGKVQKLVTRQ